MKLNKANITIYGVILTILLSLVKADSIFDDSDRGLISYMARSNDLLQQDPTRSLDCFNKYIPMINEIASNYEASFQECLNQSVAASAKADEETVEERRELANAAEATCALIKQCQEDKPVEDIFECYINGGSASINTMYIINANASQDLAVLREQYHIIRSEEYKCTNKTKRAYEKQSAAAYAGLNNCILGNPEKIITTEPSTITTNAAVETTSANDNPTTQTENSESPEETTSASSTESSALPETTTETPTEPATETTNNPTTVTPEIIPEESTTENPEE